MIMGHPLEAKETLKGFSYPLLNIKKLWRKRVAVQFARKVRDAELFRHGFIRNDIRATVSDIRLKAGHFL
jgi:hypothetical protein